MFSFFRNGVNFIVWASDDISMLRDNILEISKGQELSLEEAFDSSGEDDTIVILTKEMADKIAIEEGFKSFADMYNKSEDSDFCYYTEFDDIDEEIENQGEYYTATGELIEL